MALGWLLKERRSPTWKQGWTENTLSSMSAPPLPVVAIVGIVILLLWISSYTSYKSQVQTTMINFNLFLLLLPLLLLFLADFINKYERLAYPATNPTKKVVGQAEEDGSSPWGVAALVVLLLVLIWYQSSFKSLWSPAIWRSN
ncbi:Transmembrane protein [Quillaja saponaria]|uniref:Transmembrane protein n=1 Tax=Quillaja saponaria TaxID=32244 RepID=A0AAD7PJH9_QUISA|nr:Transmembrane protein [Quillaja saponaria]